MQQKVLLSMEENFEGYNEEISASVSRYRSMLKNKDTYYFDVFEFEHIIDFFMDKNDFKSAENAVEYALNQHPHSLELQIKKSQILINQGFPLKALKLLERIEKIESSNHTIFYLQGAVYASLGNINKAIELFEHSLSLIFETKEDLLYNIAMTFKQVGRYDLSNKYLLKLYRVNSEDESALYELANNYRKLEDDELSIRFYKEYIAQNPFSSTAWFNLGRIYQNIEEHELAIQAFEYAIAIEPDYKAAYFQKGISLFETEQFWESISIFEDYLEFDSDDTETLFHIGEIYAKLEDYQKANEYYDQVLLIDNEFEDAWYSKAVILYEQGKYVDALYYLKKAINIDDDPDFWSLSAIICRKLDFVEEAEKAFKKAIELDDSNPEVWIEYSKINFGHTKIYKTINILSEANELFEDNAEINFRLAAYLALINNFEAAKLHLEKALKQDVSKLSAFRLIFTQKNETFEDLITQFLGTEQTKN